MHFPHAPRIAVGSANPVKVGAVTQVVRQWQAAARIEAVRAEALRLEAARRAPDVEH